MVRSFSVRIVGKFDVIKEYIDHFLAHLEEVQEAYCTTPGIGVGVHIYVKVF